MTNLTEARRKAFVELCYQLYGSRPDQLCLLNGKDLWQIYNAALDSAVVKLPELSNYIDRYGQGEDCDEYVTAVIEAIHAAGVKTDE